jgi:leucyl-tRNA synthetase
MEYNFREVEQKWQQYWKENKTFKTYNPGDEDYNSSPSGRSGGVPYYVLDMFPYPSGAGLHVGHPLGYIASDILARYKRLKGFNVLHPMGYDSFGLPAEQYAIQTGQHPAITTENNIARYREQLDKIGFSFDWDREVRTSDPNYYKWTQWIFIQLFNSWYNKTSDKTEKIETLIAQFEINGNASINAACDDTIKSFSATEWKAFSEKEKSDVLMAYRIAYLGEAYVNWCPQLGTVLANDEVKDGVSERGGYPVERKLMKQWNMRITAYADRLLNGLNDIDWSESIKEAQRNWIGKSEGTSIRFHLSPGPSPQERGVRSSLSSSLNSESNKEENSKKFYTTDGQMWNLLIDKAKRMRSNPTPAESAIWQALRADSINHKIRRQHIIGRFIVDLVCLSKMLVIEIDGDIHDYQLQEDADRTQLLNNKGFKVIRFKNEEVLANIDGVVKRIVDELNNLPTSYPNSDIEITIVQDGEEEYSTSNFENNNQFNQSEEVKNILGPNSPSPEERWQGGEVIEVFTTRPDTIFGVSFVTLAPEHELVSLITTSDRKKEVEEYVNAAKNRSERERQADVKRISGVFTGSYVEHPFTKKHIPIWIGDYVLAGYGTGAVMAVPAHDSRDFAFATHFGLEKPVVIQPPVDWDFADKSYDEKEGKLINSDFLNGLEVKAAIKKAIVEIEKRNIGKGKTNFRLRDAVFGRQRYWGEPIPIYYENGIPKALPESELPLVLPEVDKFLPTESGEPPLARAKDFKYNGKYDYEHSTMPGWAGSSWYFLRYMDAHNSNEFVSKEAADYWKNVDLYIGGSEHATGHLLYVRFWTKALKDLGFISIEEPAKKLINQGMIQGRSNFVFELNSIIHNDESNHISDLTLPSIFISNSYTNLILNYESADSTRLKLSFDIDPVLEKSFVELENLISKSSNICNEKFKRMYPNSNGSISFHTSYRRRHVDVNIVENDILNIEDFKNSREEYKNAEFILEDGKYICGSEVEKMSKSKWNVVSPDLMVEQHGADCLRLYEMFLGPLELSKPWNTNGITGVSNFIRKLWRLYHSKNQESRDKNQEEDLFFVSDEQATKPELKALHKTIKKITEDIEKFSFNTSVSNFMICVNELTELKCNKREILEPLIILIAPYAPHIAEELWSKLGHTDSITYAEFPICNESYLLESTFNYPISFNGKTRFFQEYDVALTKEELEKEVLSLEQTQKYLEGNTPKKIIIVPKKIVNIVI